MTSQVKKFTPPGVFAKQHNGSPMYSQVVVVPGSGKLVFISGQVARDEEGRVVGKGDMRAQIKKVGENLKACLEAAGGSLSSLVKSTTFVTNYAEYSRHLDLRMEIFGAGLPTAATIEVKGLASEDYFLELEAIAYIE